MAKVFLDANVFIDLVEKRKPLDRKKLYTHSLYLSPLSIHILAYLYKYKVPDERFADIDRFFNLIPFDLKITIKALEGPTADLEDNIQLHSAAEAECDLFLTNDTKLLNIKFFGKMQILPDLISPVS